jgi:apolipoprotein N-acyltransferase
MHQRLNASALQTLKKNLTDKPAVGYLLAAAAGAALSLAFAPFSWWPLAILSPAILLYLWQDASPRAAAWLGFYFNAGTFAVGTYWLYISIHGFGQAPVWLALAIMAALVAIMGLYHAALGYCVARWLPKQGHLRWLLGVPAAWVLIEWWRGWFLSGFAWLSLGYSQTDTVLAHLTPIFGVYGVSLMLLLNAGAVVALLRSRARLLPAVVLIVPWLAGWAVSKISWTQVSGSAVAVAIVQGAIPQDQKWLKSNRQTTLTRYRELTEQVLGTPLIVWPEAAPPDLANNLTDYLGELYRSARARGSDILLGVPRASDDGEQYFNSVLALADGVAWYDKTHLVPFGEFFPVPDFIRTWLRLRSLPYADFTAGAAAQPPLRAGGLNLAMTICYEDAYGSAQLSALRTADVLVNVTNDAWFGRSTARHQHFQIARLRAIESQRYLIRAANDGISAIISPTGAVVKQAPEFAPSILRATVEPRQGAVPYMYWGNGLVVSGAVLMLGIAGWRRNL